MSYKSLILHPRNPYAACDTNVLIAQLKDTGFLGENFVSHEKTYFRPGKQFYRLITFVSSHPIGILKRTPSGLEVRETVDSKSHCKIHFRKLSPLPGAITSPLAGENPARCLNCAYMVADWPALISDWHKNPLDFYWSCPDCQIKCQIHELDWRRSAGFARYAAVIPRPKQTGIIPRCLAPR